MIYYYYKNPFNESISDSFFKNFIQKGNLSNDHYFALSYAIWTKINFNEAEKYFNDVAFYVLKSLDKFSFHHEIDLVHHSLSLLIMKNLDFASKIIPKLSVSNIKFVGQILNIFNGHNENFYPGILEPLNDLNFHFD